jgi:hypothetical protein
MEAAMALKPKGIAPHFLVEDVKRAAEFYRDRLGFEIGPYFRDPPAFVIVQRDDVAIQLARMDSSRGGPNRLWKEETFDAYVWVADVERLHREFAARGAAIAQTPTLWEYGMKEMDVRHADGFVIRFGEDVPG